MTNIIDDNCDCEACTSNRLRAEEKLLTEEEQTKLVNDLVNQMLVVLYNKNDTTHPQPKHSYATLLTAMNQVFCVLFYSSVSGKAISLSDYMGTFFDDYIKDVLRPIVKSHAAKAKLIELMAASLKLTPEEIKQMADNPKSLAEILVKRKNND